MVLLNEHFKDERRMVSCYKWFYFIVVPLSQVISLIYPVYCLVVNTSLYTDGKFVGPLMKLRMARQIFLTLWFIFAMVRLRLEMYRSYQWLFWD